VAAFGTGRRDELREALRAEAEACDRHTKQYGLFSEAVMAWREEKGA
jgi:hypothetical protein